MTMNVVDFAKALMEVPSVTPHGGAAFDVLTEALENLGFSVSRVTFEEGGTEPVENLYARRGTASPNLCFAGHTDVVPPGDFTRWDSHPFQPEVRDGLLYGRGAEDMKGAIAAFVTAIDRFSGMHEDAAGSISLLITGDEEGPAINGTTKMLDWLKAKGEKLDACIVGEPTNPSFIGEMIKIGRRGSVTFDLTVEGKQGHVAYPDQADNPVTRMVKILHALKAEPIDEGNEFFPPSNLEVTSVDVGNDVVNLIPARARAKFNIRFNNLHSGESMVQWVQRVCEEVGGSYALEPRISGDAFLTKACRLSETLVEAVQHVTGKTPKLSTTGGTSDARFIKDFCPVVEFGATGFTPHMVNECVSVEALEQLTAVYTEMLKRYFAAS